MKATYEEAITFLAEHKIFYEEINHQAVWHMSKQALPVAKNLFLKTNQETFYLCLMAGNKKLDFKRLAQSLKVSRRSLAFATTAELRDVLAVEPGVVTPLALQYDLENRVTVVLDRDLSKFPKIGIHPNVNTATIFVSYPNLVKIIDEMGHAWVEM